MILPRQKLGKEVIASSQALATMKKPGASKSRKQLESAYKTYYHNKLGKI